jgi:tetratricopeptide (TPR) repeat protein
MVRALLAVLMMIPALSDVEGQQPETLSLLDEPLYARKLPKSERAKADAELARAHADYTRQPNAPDTILALARAHVTLGRVGDAVVILTHGLETNPDEARLLVERGRGYVSLRKFGPAQRDFSKVAEKSVDARCGVALTAYLMGDYDRARISFSGCPNPGILGYLAERRSGRTPTTKPTADGPPPSSSAQVRLPGTVATNKPGSGRPIAASYLAAIERLLAGDENRAREELKKIVEKNRGDWMEPAYIAAEADYVRLKKPSARRGRR